MKYRIVAFSLLFFGFLFLLLQQTNAYHFFYMEQSQLFLFTDYYLASKASVPGGLASYAGDFLSQFFILPYAGAAITAGLLTLVTLLTALICKRMAPGIPLYILYLLPATMLLFMHFNFNYLIQGSIAFLMLLFLLFFHIRIHSFRGRMVYALLSTLFLYWFGGAVVNLYAVSLLLWELLNNRKTSYWFLFPVMEAFLLSWLSIRMAWIGELRFAFLPDAYFHDRLTSPTVIYFAWISLPVVLILTCLFRKQTTNWKREAVISTVQLVFIGLLFYWSFPRYNDVKSAYFKELDYHTRHGQWDTIIDRFQAKATNYLYLCYLNMALAEKGELAERMFTFDQRTANGLMVNWNKTTSVSSLLSSIHFTIGNMALAQEMAFECNVSAIGECNPFMLQRLVQTNLIYGAYPVAEKYLDILSNSLFYRKWAEEHRRFLQNDAAVEQDPLLGAKRRNLIEDNYLSYPTERIRDFINLAEYNPSNRAPFEYLGAAYLLSKDVMGFRQFIEHYYGTPVLPSLPKSYQEAIIAASEGEPEYWTSYDIPEDTIKRFQEFKKQILANRNNGNPANLLRRSFGDTYWFYFMFK